MMLKNIRDIKLPNLNENKLNLRISVKSKQFLTAEKGY